MKHMIRPKNPPKYLLQTAKLGCTKSEGGIVAESKRVLQKTDPVIEYSGTLA